ncbi:hypothetical protein [Paenibacillus prosopidis]|uniref:Uncharacterized protein n=1 Tax=Paenibacillus prosopidis TaxID=630520 RepID=A0A368W8T7_9BACL|nr:hypothetical protein [Paenibacillus prosopidis]RCW50841.1 hypothetical protein DFP97_10233 [Paenibacillus prosopidis]
MDDLTAKSSCQIQRIGEVVRLEEHFVLILCNGKMIEVPNAKVDADVRPGDQVSWTGCSWSCIN